MTQYFEQFRWIERTLEAAAKNGEKVIIIGHISPGRLTAIESYGDFYVPVVSRYRDIIVGQFFGHDHRDGFEVVTRLVTRQTDRRTDGQTIWYLHAFEILRKCFEKILLQNSFYREIYKIQSSSTFSFDADLYRKSPKYYLKLKNIYVKEK